MLDIPLTNSLTNILIQTKTSLLALPQELLTMNVYLPGNITYVQRMLKDACRRCLRPHIMFGIVPTLN